MITQGPHDLLGLSFNDSNALDVMQNSALHTGG